MYAQEVMHSQLSKKRLVGKEGQVHVHSTDQDHDIASQRFQSVRSHHELEGYQNKNINKK